MNNWQLCDGRWINFDSLVEVFVRKANLPPLYIIRAEYMCGEVFTLFDKGLHTRAEAQEFLDKWMLNAIRGTHNL